jgi:choline dehydrogenase-like flavoprotein/nucleoside-diphosphate-sugar epimerase
VILSATEIEDGRVLEADVCIVGAGAAGITLALDFIDSKLDVLLLESGDTTFDPQNQSLYEGSVVDERLHSQPVRFRQRQFGGSTTIWGGRCMPLDAIDFESRSYVPHSGWPIELSDVMPFYPRANRLCEAGEFAYTVADAFSRPLRPMIEGFQSTHFATDGLERFSCPTNFAARYGHRLRSARNIRVVLHANVTSISLPAGARQVESLRVETLNGRRWQARARFFVLATGGLEVPRLLLASREQHAEGIGNGHDVVGRFYMCHLAGTIGALRFRGATARVHHGYDVSDDGTYCRRRLALRPAVQRTLGLGNFIARLHHPRIPDPAHHNSILSLLFLARPLIPYEYAKRLHGTERISGSQWLHHFCNVAARPFDAFGFAWHMLRDRKWADRKFPSVIIRSRANLYSLDFHAEQQPNPDSRVRLSRDLDALKVPRLLVDWRYASGDVQTVRGALALLAADLTTDGVGELCYDPQSVELEMTRYGAYDGHHIGTARMGRDPRTSVVDANCAVHGLANLYVAGSAVFPTSGQANPTLTIVALALRLAAHVKSLSLSGVQQASSTPHPPPDSARLQAPLRHATPAAVHSPAVRSVLVLGADGFIGEHVVRALAPSGLARIITDVASAKRLSQPLVEGVPLDATSLASLKSVLARADAIVNCTSGRPTLIAAVAKALYGAAAQHEKPPLIVQVGSMSVYGAITGDITESTPPGKGLGTYARAQASAEQLAGQYPRSIILRTGCEYGAGGELWSGRVARWLFAHRLGDLGVAGDGYCNLVHVDDVASAVLLSLHQTGAVGQILNLAMPDPPTWNEYLVEYAKALGAVPVRRISRRRLWLETKVYAVPLKIVELGAQALGVGWVPPPIPPSFARLAAQEIRIDSGRARNVLGWRCRPLEQGISEAAAWFSRDRRRIAS